MSMYLNKKDSILKQDVRKSFIDIHILDFPKVKENHCGVCVAFERYVVRCFYNFK